MIENNIVKIALIGFGKRGKTHFRNLKNISKTKIVAICDAQNVKNLIGDIPYFENYESMLENVEAEAVIISVPTNLHYKIARKCIEKKKHILIEKPVAFVQKQAFDLMSQPTKFNVLCMVGYNLRFDKKINKIKTIIKAGELGKILMIRGRQSHNWGGGEPFSWSLDIKQSGGGTIIDNATHYFDLFQYLIGDISEIHAFANSLGFNKSVEDNALISLKFKSGVIGSIETSWNDASGRNNQLTIWGSNAVLEYIDSNEIEFLKIKKYRSDVDEWNRADTQQIYLPKGIEQIAKTNNIDNSKAFSTESTFNMLSFFVNTIRRPRQIKKFLALNNIEKNVRLVSAAYESIKQRKTIKI
jgi:myo-inositol 2-dehydrogenase/D-chiro-inositol 1-dehydrogenase